MLLLRGPTATATAACWVAMMALALRSAHRRGVGVCRAFSTVQLQPALSSGSQHRRAADAASAAGIGGTGNSNAAMHASSAMMSARAYASTGYSTAALRQTNALFAASTTATDAMTDASSSSDVSSSSEVTLLGIDWVRECVAKVLNDAFDPAEVARGAALAKLEPKKKKNKKKKKKAQGAEGAEKDAAPAEDEKPKMSEEEKQAILDAAAAAARPFGELDTAVTAATKAEFGDYQCNAAMALAKNVGMAPRDCAAKIVEGLQPLIGRYMEEPEIAGPGFINLRFKEDYLAQAVRSMSEDAGGRLAVPPVA